MSWTPEFPEFHVWAGLDNLQIQSLCEVWLLQKYVGERPSRIATAWDILNKNHGSKAEETLLTRLRDQRGTLDVLRQGIELLGLKAPLTLAQFKPALVSHAKSSRRRISNQKISGDRKCAWSNKYKGRRAHLKGLHPYVDMSIAGTK